MFSKTPELKRGATYWVALSGGLDSTVLLHRLKHDGVKPLRAIHVHHGLQKKADAWVAHCRRLCTSLKVPLTIERVRINPDSDDGPEAAARDARYAALRKHLRSGDCLLTAHHRDDQAETVLLRLLRGTGIHGLAAVRSQMNFEPGTLWRPLLDTPRAQLLAYAKQHRLKWIEDPHNRDDRYARSWLRKNLMPDVQRRFPSALASLARTAAHAAEASELLDVLAEHDSISCHSRASGRNAQHALMRAQRVRRMRPTCGPDNPEILSVSGLLALTPARRNNLLRYWIRQCGHETPAAETLVRIETEVLRARADADPLLAWGDCELRRYRDSLHLLPRQRAAVLPKVKLPAGLRLRFPKGGERLKPAGSAHTRSLKNLFQEAGVPPWVRQRTPLIFENEQPIAVLGLVHTARSLELGLDRIKIR